MTPVPVTAALDEQEDGNVLLWTAVAALLASASFLFARYVGLGPAPGPWAYWPIHGLLCGLLFHRPFRQWGWIVSGAVVSQILTIYLSRGDIAGGATAVGALGGAAQSMLGAWILGRQSAGLSPLENPRVLAWFVVVGVVLTPLLISPFSALAFAYGLGLPVQTAWWPLFVGNSLSMLLFAPIAIQRWKRVPLDQLWLAGAAEAFACLGLLVVVTIIAFTNASGWLQFVALPYAVFPLLAWAAVRGGPQWTAVSIITLTTIASWCTARGSGPFAHVGVPQSEAVFHLEAYLAFVAFTGLLLSALTEQRRRSLAQRAIDEAIRSALFESSSSLIVLKDVDGRYVMVNRAAEEAYGVPREALIGQHPSAFLDAESARTVQANDQRMLARGESLQFEEALSNGVQGRLFLMTRFPVRDAQGVIRYLGMIGLDQTLERQLADKLQRAQRVELVGQMAAGLAHDLNNLLSVLVMGVGELGARAGRSADEQQILEEMNAAGAQATRLTSRLLAFGRSTPVSKAPVDPDAALRGLTPLLGALVRSRIDLSVTLGAPGARVIAEPAAIEQILLNLVANARDAIAGEGTIAVRSTAYTRGTSAGVRITVTDSGSGMDAETRARVFEPFFSTKQDGAGTGLGLYNTLLLVQQAGGTITVESEPGKGTTFTIELPADGEQSSSPR